jgi:hypothetical protein
MPEREGVEERLVQIINEAAEKGPIAALRNGDIVKIDKNCNFKAIFAQSIHLFLHNFLVYHCVSNQDP